MVGTSNPSVLERFPWSHGALEKKNDQELWPRNGGVGHENWWKHQKPQCLGEKMLASQWLTLGKLLVDCWWRVGSSLVGQSATLYLRLAWGIVSLDAHRRSHVLPGFLFDPMIQWCRSYLDIFKMATSNESNESNMASDWKLPGRFPLNHPMVTGSLRRAPRFGKCHCHQPGGGHPDLDHPNGAADGIGLVGGLEREVYPLVMSSYSYWKRP